MREKPVRSPIVPPTDDSLSTNLAASSCAGLWCFDVLNQTSLYYPVKVGCVEKNPYKAKIAAKSVAWRLFLGMANLFFFIILYHWDPCRSWSLSNYYTCSSRTSPTYEGKGARSDAPPGVSSLRGWFPHSWPGSQTPSQTPTSHTGARPPCTASPGIDWLCDYL